MNFLKIESFGKPDEVIMFAQRDCPTPNKNEVLIKMIKACINPSDLLTIRGIYASRITLPYIPGFEGVGKVVSVNQGGNKSLIGQRVVTLCGHGTWQEYIVAPKHNTIIVPNELSDNTAAQLYVNPLTAWLILKKLAIKCNQYLLLNACNSAIGKLFCQLAKVFGFKVIGLVRDDKHINSLLSFGASTVINTSLYNSFNTLNKAIKEFTDNQPIQHGLDAVGGSSGLYLAQALGKNAHFIQYGLMSNQPLPQRIWSSPPNNIHMELFHLRSWLYKTTPEARRKTFNEMLSCFTQNDLKLPIAQTYPLNQAKEAILHAQTPGKSGKILFHF